MSHLEMLKLTTKFNCNVFITDYDCKFNSPNSQKIVEEYFEFAYKFNLNHLHNKFFQMKKEYDHWCEQNVDWNWLRSNKRMQYVWNLNYFVKLGSKSWLRVLFCQFSVNWLKRISQNCPNCPFMTFWQNFREINSLHAFTFLAATCEAISRKKKKFNLGWINYTTSISFVKLISDFFFFFKSFREIYFLKPQTISRWLSTNRKSFKPKTSKESTLWLFDN